MTNHFLIVSLPQSIKALDYLGESCGSSFLTRLDLPDFQLGTLDSLVQQSDDLAKFDSQLALALAKATDVLDQIEGSSQRSLYVDRQCDCILSFRWNSGKFHLDKPLVNLVSAVVDEALQLDADLRSQFQQLQQHKTLLAAADRKQNGDLLVRLLHEIVKPRDFVVGSDNLQSLAVAVPRQLVLDFIKSYETVLPFVVPRLALEIAQDKEYSLYVVTVFKKHLSAFVTASRDHKWCPRTDFEYLDELLQAMRDEYDALRRQELALRTDTIRLARTAAIELCTLYMHLKTIRVYVELVLRYGLPPQFDCFVLGYRDNSKACQKAKKDMLQKYGYLGNGSVNADGSKPNLKEYAALVDTEYEPFVLYELTV